MKKTHKAFEVDVVTEGSSNVFADLGVPNADQELIKVLTRNRAGSFSVGRLIDF